MVSLHAALAAMALSGVGQTVLYDFYADWCGPCRMMDPVVKQLHAQGYPIQQINIDRDRGLAYRYHVTNIPCFVMIVDGREVDREVGGTSPQRLVQMCRLGGASRGTSPPTMLAGGGGPGAFPPINVASGATCPVQHSPATSPGPVVMADATLPVWQTGAAPAASEGPTKSDADLVAATVRLRVEDAQGHSCGTGTIIDCRRGEALILTCGHLFRDSKGRGKIEVDLFAPNAVTKVAGSLVAYEEYDDKHDVPDVGLVRISVPFPVAVAPVAPPGYAVRVGQPIATVGCSNGDDPTVRRTRVTALGKYSGPANVEVADLPVVGRSGGGLFTSDGFVIGVCNAADPTDREGLYAALPSIVAELDRLGLSFVYRDPSAAPIHGAPPAVMPAPVAVAVAAAPPAAPRHDLQPTSDRLTSEEQAFLEKIRQEKCQGAEVICIIRPKNPENKSEVLMLERASKALLDRLNAESQDDAQNTVLDLSRPRPAGGNPVIAAGATELR
jgi:thiol-disulfide isomerase/thioredoxin